MPSIPRLHVVTDDDVLGSGDFEGRARALLEAGGDGLALHLRGPRSSGRRLYDLAWRLRDVARASGAPLLVNDRADVALAAGATGVHLGQRSLPVRVARGLLGPERLLGVSVHDAAALAAAVADGANYVLVGTVYPTTSHPGRKGMGADGLAEIMSPPAGIPALAIGGVDVRSVGAVLGAGAHGVAVLSGIWSHRDPAGAARDYLAALDDAKHGMPSGGANRRRHAEENR